MISYAQDMVLSLKIFYAILIGVLLETIQFGGGRNEGNIGWFSSNVNNVLGNGSSNNFWQEKSLGGMPLCFEFPHVFR
jgi:hypothetical protein